MSGNIEKEDAFKTLANLLETFDIPDHKIASISWLKKHLKSRNLNNPLYKEIMDHLNNMTSHGWTVY